MRWRSLEPERPPTRTSAVERFLPRRLVERVAWVAFAAIAGSAACVAVVSVAVAEQFALRREERQLENAATVLAKLLARPGVDPAFATAHEAREVQPTGIRLAVYRGGRFFAGDPLVRASGSAGCTSDPAVTVCSVDDGRFLSAAARDTAFLREQRRSILLSGLCAVAAVSVLGALLARHIARSLVAPLSRLSHAIERVPANAPEAVDLGADEGVEEVDSLRSTVRTAFARLGHSLATTRRFAADAAHELRSPLTVILGELELSARSLEGEARDANEHARRTAARLATLVDRLLVLATPATKLELGEELELHSAVDDGLDLIPMGSWPRVSVSSESEAYVQGDRALLASMIANAIENALKFSTGPVSVKLRALSERAQIEISDDGPGIPAAESERVFEPFFRTRATRASGTPGHGIGLSLIAHVSTLHGGRARFLPREHGSSLVIDLPRAR